jgi:hypothetical protein
MREKKTGIPLYTKVGIRVTVVLMLVIAFFLVRNCTSSIYYGSATSPEAIREAYELGVRQGKDQALGVKPTHPYTEQNPILRKAYQKGFRTGWDGARNNLPNTLSPTSTATPTSPKTPPATATSNSEGR